MFGASHKDPCAMFRLGLSSKGGNMALRIDLHIFPCQRFEIWDPANLFFSVQLPKILRPTSNTAIFFSRSLMLSTPFAFPVDSSFIITQNPIVYCAYSMGWYQPQHLCDLEKITLPALSLPFSAHLRSSGQSGKVWCDPASGCCPLDHSRAPELRGAQPLVNKQGLIWTGREVALKPIWCLLTESFLWKLALYTWKDFVGREWGREKKMQGEELSHVHYETI